MWSLRSTSINEYPFPFLLALIKRWKQCLCELVLFLFTIFKEEGGKEKNVRRVCICLIKKKKR